MQYRIVGKSNLKVSEICLGSMNWGEQNTEVEAHEQLDYAISQGINFIDTAEIYPVPPNPLSQGRTEKYIGSWLKKKGNRKKLIIASKVTGHDKSLRYIRGGFTPRLNKKNIQSALNGSLKRLQTDYIDLYQLHWPDRNTNYFGERAYKHDPKDQAIPIEETLEALKDFIKEGKIRYVGVSNETAWGLMESLKASKEKNLPRIQSIQNPYNLILREYETSLAEVCIKEDISLLVYSPLAFGVLTGKYLDGKTPKGSRFDHARGRNRPRYDPPHAQIAIKKYVDLAKKHGLDPAQMAIAFVNSRPFVTSTIIGATSVDQLKTDIESKNVKLEKNILIEIEKIHEENPNPIT
ncbi:aldo/keto reductase [Candidatus Roizmanbacteria bacterium RIFCSPLOWO2_02_FULL_40_13]|nr:MAG: aldo/keto reductase [Candidatus Roizmanbacteria bacterium RIFCSPLOWO2_02_FULL_40_13]